MKQLSIFLASFLSLGIFSSIVLADDVSDLISQSESSSAGEASRLIDSLRNNSRRESSSAAKIIDSLNKEARVSSNQGSASRRVKSSSSASTKKFPKQETLKNIPLLHEGKEKCGGKASLRSGKCRSSLLQGLEAKQSLNSSSNTQFLIFVSQSMPASSIKELFQQSQKVGGKLLFRGLIGGSFKETQSSIQELGIVADIDPTKFEEYGVTFVPTFVLSKGERHDKMTGNITLSSFLEQASQIGDLKEQASDLYNQLQGDKP